jgi:DNA-directed RNA polymerase specialized sigma subunit
MELEQRKLISLFLNGELDIKTLKPDARKVLVVYLLNKGETYIQIAKCFGISKSRVAQIAKMYNLRRTKRDLAFKEEIYGLIKNKMSYVNIAVIYGLTKGRVAQIKKEVEEYKEKTKQRC